MCCFSRPVETVFGTRIFARPDKDARQFVAYQMSYRAKEDLAMILPLPVARGSGEDAVTFIDLSGYKSFFSALSSGFPTKQKIGLNFGCSAGDSTPPAAPVLPVVDVGDYEASFVPAIKDFARLDERFRLPDDVWPNLPAYKEYGFAVFKLRHKPGTEATHPWGIEVQPMAFTFPSANPRTIFFPTVHIHDGKIHEEAEFDHTLYCQPAAGSGLSNLAWKESPKLAKEFVSLEKSKSIIAGDQHCYKLDLRGMLANKDVTVATV